MRAFVSSGFLALICLAFFGVANGQTPGLQEGDRGTAARQVLNEAVADTAFPGAVAVAGRGGEVLTTVSAGRYGIDDSRLVADSTVYDLASVTKVVSMTTAIMLLVADGVLEIDGYVHSYLPRFSGGGKDSVRVRHLLTHTSGLPSWRPLYLEATDRREAIDSLYSTRLDTIPGVRYRYSDLGAITLGLVVESIVGRPLDEIMLKRVWHRLGMTSTGYVPDAYLLDHVAPTELDPVRGRIIRGEVHDENCWRLGGVSGHAGLFSNAPDLAVFAQWMLDLYHGRVSADHPLYVPPAIVAEFTRRQDGPEGSTRALGWDTPSDSLSTAGTLMSRVSFGHTGFTGTSIWIDPVNDLFVILLTNRVHPTRRNHKIGRVRGLLADAVVSELVSSEDPR
jgi:CubicO group peptidase (beta-lactamase class C family)